MAAANALVLTPVRWTMTPMTLVLVSIAFLVGLVIGMIFGAAMTVFFGYVVDDDSRQRQQHGRPLMS